MIPPGAPKKTIRASPSVPVRLYVHIPRETGHRIIININSHNCYAMSRTSQVTMMRAQPKPSKQAQNACNDLATLPSTIMSGSPRTPCIRQILSHFSCRRPSNHHHHHHHHRKRLQQQQQQCISSIMSSSCILRLDHQQTEHGGKGLETAGPSKLRPEQSGSRAGSHPHHSKLPALAHEGEGRKSMA